MSTYIDKVKQASFWIRRDMRQIILKAMIFLMLFMWAPLTIAAENKSSFDHDKTGFFLDGAHQRIRCDTCHQRGMFKGTPVLCQGCHGRAGLIAATKKPANHIQSDETCDDCHTDVRWAGARMDHVAVTGSCLTCHNGRKATGKSPAHIQSHNLCEECHRTIAWLPARFDHGAITGSCFTCHNGTTATGKTPNHIQSGNTCDDCHSTIAWLPAGFDHSNVTGGCSTCHNGVRVTGKSPTHIQSSNSCESCHRTTAWKPATFDHSNAAGACSSCHNGVTATGKSPTHIQSGNVCDDCHNTTAWSPANFDHATVTGSCSNCHNGTTATGKTPNHFGTSQQCNECHNTNAWRPINFTHMTPNYPGDHSKGLECTGCHTSNNSNISWTFPAYKPDCAGCHANDYKQDKHKKVDSPKILYSVSELRDCTSSCHEYTDATFTTIKKTRSNEHAPGKNDW